MDDEPCRGEGLQQHVLLRGGEWAHHLVAVEDPVPDLLLGAPGIVGGDARADAGAAGVLLGGDVDARGGGGGGGDAGGGAEGGHFSFVCLFACACTCTTVWWLGDRWMRGDFLRK